MAYGAHVHFEVLVNNKNIDPTPYINGQSQIPTEKPVGQILRLAANEPRWRVYDLNIAPVVGNEKGFILPAKFGGLEYEILGYTQKTVAIIETRDFGRVQIYINATGATIV